MAGRARPTLRCLREDLALAVPRADTPLEDIGHPLLGKVGDRFADDDTSQERIAAIDDQVLFKVKIQRWRGAVWVDAGIPWLVAAGQREEGSPDDFYAALAARATAARARYNARHSPALATATCTGDPPGLVAGSSSRAVNAAMCTARTSPNPGSDRSGTPV